MTDTAKHDGGTVERDTKTVVDMQRNVSELLMQVGGHKPMIRASVVSDALDAACRLISKNAAEIERLRADCERFRSEADIANAQVKAWNEAVYVEGIPRRAIPDTDYGDKVPPIPHVEPKKVIDLLDENKQLRDVLRGINTPLFAGMSVKIDPGTEMAKEISEALKGGA